MFSFLTRFFQKKSPPIKEKSIPNRLQIDFFNLIAHEEEGIFFENFTLFYQDQQTTIALLLFLPYRGLYFGETITWDYETLQKATIEQSSKKKSSTRLETTESAIHEKLEYILSFDSTVCERFFWMSALSEDEFDTLDPSFHSLLPKERLIFKDSSIESIHQKLKSFTTKQIEPYSSIKIIGSLQSHTLILPTDQNPYGQFLSNEQLTFLQTDYTDTVTTLFGEHNSGKSTLIIRKALLLLLSNPEEKVLIITPTLIGGEILRKEFISLLEYGALKIELTSLRFYAPNSNDKIEEMECFLSSSTILCDDAHIMEKKFIDTLINHRDKRWLLLSLFNIYAPINNSSIILYEHYQKNLITKKISSVREEALMNLLLELRGHLLATSEDTIMVILENEINLAEYKEAIDEYFEINCRILTREFSLQYQNIDDLILTTQEYTYGLHVAHIYLMVSDEEENYTYALSRASESATIISFSNTTREQ